MKNRLAGSYLLLIIVIAVATALGQESDKPPAKPLSPQEQAVVASDKAFGEAQKKKDIDFLKRTLTDDFVGVGTDGKPFDKSDVLENVLMADIQEYRAYDAKVLSIGDGVVILSYDCIIRMTLYDEPIPRYQHISSVWIKQGDEWRLKFQQATAAQ